MRLRRYLIAGLLVWLPIWATLVILEFLIKILDGSLKLLPAHYQPAELLGYDIPGMGVLFALLVIFFTGMIASNFFGSRLVKLGEGILARIPLVRSIYRSVKQVAETVFASDKEAFNKVLLVEYPRKGLWSIAFQTGQGNPEVNQHIQQDMVTIFIPTTPNPTSGFLMMLPKQDVIELSMTVEQGLKFVISLGMVQPSQANGKKV